jgi:hypothetical protein
MFTEYDSSGNRFAAFFLDVVTYQEMMWSV